MQQESYRKDGKLRIELLDTEAEQYASSFYNAKPRLTSAQLRNFYHDVKSIQRQLQTINEGERKDRFEKELLQKIKMMKPKAFYASNPSRSKIPDTFKNFLVKNIDMINSIEDFEDFMLHFEAVVGFFYGKGGR